MKRKVFKWNGDFPLQLMRIEPLGKLYAYSHQEGDMMVFKMVPHGGYKGSWAMLKSLRGQRAWTQADAAKQLGISQASVSKYEQRKKTMENWLIRTIEVLKAGPVYAKDWSLPHKNCRVRVFRLTNGMHIAFMRIRVTDRLYAYAYHKDEEMYFKVWRKRMDSGVGIELKDLRKKLGWTQAQAGIVLGVNRTTIAKYEAGRRILDGLPFRKFLLLKQGGGTVEGIRKLLHEIRKLQGTNSHT